MPEIDRPNPDLLLKQVEAEDPGRGRLKLYLGMAAGVGKTYTMLADAQEAAKRGVDVTLGYLEPHGRAETEELAEGLEQIPLATVVHGGIQLKEFNIDAALARRPGLLLLDELAHTNAPGVRHKKRWQDAEELLAAGIDVNTTVNIQHFESLNDVVAQITGIRVAETVPDSLLTAANEIELVDIPPDDLIQRIREGKVYVPEKVEQALDGFFKKKHLTALRELALRKTAERVDAQVQSFRAIEGAKEPWATQDRILVAVAPSKLSTRVVRAAKRMADSLHGEFLAVFIESDRQNRLSEMDRAYAEDSLRLAERLGAKTATLNGSDIVGELLLYAQSQNVTTIVMGKPLRPRWKELAFGSVVDDMVRRSGDIDVHVITATESAGTRVGLVEPQELKDWSGIVPTAIVVGLCTLVGLGIHSRVSNSNIVMVYLLGVTWVASRYSRNAAMLASVLSVAAFDVFFVPPRFTFAVSDFEYLITFAVMLFVAVVISTLTSRIREHSTQATERERRTAALYDLSRKLSATRSRSEIGKFAAEQVRNVFGCDTAVLIRSRKSGDLFPAPPSQSRFEADPKEAAVAQWVVDHGRPAGTGTDTLPGSTGLYVPLNGETGAVGVLAVRTATGHPWDGSRLRLLETFANQLALAIERTNLAKDSHESSLAMESERLRSTLLSSVSHDFRTPLAVITGAADQLRAHLAEGKQKELAEAISTEASRLDRQVRNLLDMTRISAGALRVKKEWQSLEELVGSALARTETLLAGHSVHVDLAPDLPLMELDGVLVEQVFVNLLENASRHTLPGTSVWIDARPVGQAVRIRFSNDGPTLSTDELAHIFEKFSQGKQASGGTGLGLAICKAIVEAHGGTINAETRESQGVRFVIDLPASKGAPEVPVG